MLMMQKVKSSLYPRWNESHEFAVALDAPLDAVLSVVVWDWDRLAADDFMGMVSTEQRRAAQSSARPRGD